MCVTTDKENTHENHDRSNANENIVELQGDWEAFADEIRGTLPISLMCRNADVPWEPNGRNHNISAGLQRLQSLCFTPETKAIAPWHFYGCGSLKHLLLPDGLEKIGSGAFANCTALEEVVIPESVTEIEPKAFFKCTALRRVKISDALLHTLDDSVFGRFNQSTNMDLAAMGPMIPCLEWNCCWKLKNESVLCCNSIGS